MKDMHEQPHLGTPKRPLKVFVSYSHEDRNFLDDLLRHLTPLIERGRIILWHDGEIPAGRKWTHEIDSALAAADIIVLLVTPDFIQSEFIWEVELRAALGRQGKGVEILPVYVKGGDYTDTPFGTIQAILSKDRRPISETSNQELAWLVVADAVADAARRLLQEAPPNSVVASNWSSPQINVRSDNSEILPQPPSLLSLDWLVNVFARAGRGRVLLVAAYMTFGFDILATLWFSWYREESKRSGLRGLFDYKAAWIGDSIILPLVGALLVMAIVHVDGHLSRSGRNILVIQGSVSRYLLPIAAMALSAAVHTAWLLDSGTPLNWTIPQPGFLNAPGWWHAFYFFIFVWIFVAGTFLLSVGLSALANSSFKASTVEDKRLYSLSWCRANFIFVLCGIFVGLLTIDNAYDASIQAVASSATTFLALAGFLLLVACANTFLLRGYIHVLDEVKLLDLRTKIIYCMGLIGVFCAIAAAFVARKYLLDWPTWQSFICLAASSIAALLCALSMSANVFVLHRRGEANLSRTLGCSSFALAAFGFFSGNLTTLSISNESTGYLVAFLAGAGISIATGVVLIAAGWILDAIEQRLPRKGPWRYLTEMTPMHNITQDLSLFIILQAVAIQFSCVLTFRAQARQSDSSFIVLALVSTEFLFVFVGMQLFVAYNNYKHLRELTARSSAYRVLDKRRVVLPAISRWLYIETGLALAAMILLVLMVIATLLGQSAIHRT